MQQLRGPGEGGIDVLQLLVQLVKGGVRQGQVMLLKKSSVPAVQNAPRLIHPGQQMVIASQKKQCPDGAPVSPGHLADLHLVQGGRDGTHAVLGEHQTQHPAELLPGEGRVSQDLGELIQHTAEDLPKLAVFLRRLHPAGLHQRLRLLSQQLRHARLPGKSVESRGLVCGGRGRLHVLVQGQQRQAHLLPDGVDLLQPLSALRGHLRAIAVGVGRPGDVPQPHLAPDLPEHHIVFQLIALRPVDAGQSGFQIAEHVLVLKAAGDGVQGPQRQKQRRLLQDVAAPADVYRDAVPSKNMLQHRGVLC